MGGTPHQIRFAAISLIRWLCPAEAYADRSRADKRYDLDQASNAEAAGIMALRPLRPFAKLRG
jgi:hypothetical protein